MARDCKHMPGAAKDIECPLCRDLKSHGKVTTKYAGIVLNQQPVKPKTRTCPSCKQEVRELVSRNGETMCEACAEDLDDV